MITTGVKPHQKETTATTVCFRRAGAGITTPARWSIICTTMWPAGTEISNRIINGKSPKPLITVKEIIFLNSAFIASTLFRVPFGAFIATFSL